MFYEYYLIGFITSINFVSFLFINLIYFSLDNRYIWCIEHLNSEIVENIA